VVDQNTLCERDGRGRKSLNYFNVLKNIGNREPAYDYKGFSILVIPKNCLIESEESETLRERGRERIFLKSTRKRNRTSSSFYV
jgi:hypothetical protein